MENKKVIEISISEARGMYEQGGLARTIAMSYYQEDELKNYLPKSWEEFCEICSINEGICYIAADSSIINCNSIKKIDPSEDMNLCTDKESAEQHLALLQLHKLRDYYRGTWKPDFGKSRDIKYCIINNAGMLMVRECINFSRFLTFPDEQMATTFMNCFSDLIYKAGDLI